MTYLGRLPQYTGAKPAIWREIRGFKDYVVIGSESEQHGIQIFDMRKACYAITTRLCNSKEINERIASSC
jgi:hypothetical protein